MADVKPGAVGELVARYIATQCVVLASNDITLRMGAPRWYTRLGWLCAPVGSYPLRILPERGQCRAERELDGELVWYADVLGRGARPRILSGAPRESS